MLQEEGREEGIGQQRPQQPENSGPGRPHPNIWGLLEGKKGSEDVVHGVFMIRALF